MADDEARQRLADVRELLQQQTLFVGDAAHWAIGALDRFLNGEAASLDDAFGLVAVAHRAPDTERRFELALKADKMRDGGSSWKAVADAFSADGASITSERAIQRLVDEFRPRLTAWKVTERLNRGDSDRK